MELKATQKSIEINTGSRKEQRKFKSGRGTLCMAEKFPADWAEFVSIMHDGTGSQGLVRLNKVMAAGLEHGVGHPLPRNTRLDFQAGFG